MKPSVLALLTFIVVASGCGEPAPPKAKGIQIEAPGVKVDINKHGEKGKVDVNVDPK